MSELLSLWLPIVVSAVVVFFASFAAWMLLPHHRADHRQIPDEESFLKTLQAMNVERGRFMFPYSSSSADMKDEEFKKKWEEGPIGVITVYGGMTMGKNMFWTFVSFLIGAIFIAYLSSLAIDPGAGFMEVFRFVGTAGIMTHCLGFIPNAIWFKHPIGTNLLDGIAFGLITGVVFALLWPASG